MPTFSSLPSDVVDHLLMQLPGFATLFAIIRTSKLHVYTVFKDRKRSILTAVATNIVGPTLPYASRLISNLPEWKYPAEDQAIVNDTIEALRAVTIQDLIAQNEVLSQLEDLFSIIYKDRRFAFSVLSDIESYRFRRALYRTWMLDRSAREFVDQNSDDEDQSDDEEEDGSQGSDADMTATKRTLAAMSRMQLCLEVFESTELLEMARVAKFLVELHGLVCASNGLASNLSSISSPRLILEAYWTNSVWLPYHHQPALSSSNFSAAVTSVCNTRGISDEDCVKRTNQAILDNVYGDNDTCYRCNSAQGVKLYGPSNWHLLQDMIPHMTIIQSLKGKLRQNHVERDIINGYFRVTDEETKRNTVWSPMFHGLFEVQDDNDADWAKDRWYCKECMTVLINTRFQDWWAVKKRELDNQYASKDDCWYGYNCRTQVHKYTHAAKLNHVCKPTRGDDL